MSDTKQKCSRTRCDNPADPRLIHRDLRQAYCPQCARRINKLNGVVLIPFPTSAKKQEPPHA